MRVLVISLLLFAVLGLYAQVDCCEGEVRGLIVEGRATDSLSLDVPEFADMVWLSIFYGDSTLYISIVRDPRKKSQTSLTLATYYFGGHSQGIHLEDKTYPREGGFTIKIDLPKGEKFFYRFNWVEELICEEKE